MRPEHNPESTWRVRVEKPAGGYVFIKAEHLLKAWWAQRTGSIDLFAFRVWLACHELVARRCRMNRKLTACYRVEELPPLTGSADVARHRSAIRCLQDAGLLRWLGDDIRLEPVSPGDDGVGAVGGTDDDYLDMQAMVQNWRRKIPVPRRVIRHLAGQRRKVLIATVLGHLLRCVYYRNRAPLTGGRCKASWIADVFGVDARNVKAARKQLIDAGWLTVVASSQTALNRWGLAVVVALDHTFPACRHDTPARQSPPPRELSTAKSPPPTRNRELSARSENHELRNGRAGGVPTGQGRQAPPRLRSIALADLKQPQRLDRLFWEAVAAGIVRQTQAERLRWFAAAERALALGTRNPCGFFAAMVRRGLWHHISNAQEDTARLKLNRLDYGETPPRFEAA